MGKNTKNLDLFEYDIQTDGKQKFNINKALNENFDKIDAAFDNLKNIDLSLMADVNLSNLSLNGNSRLQFNPFAINNGKVDDNGKNATISFPKIAETIVYDYPNYKPTQNVDNTGVKSTAISGLGDTSQAYRMLNPQSFQFYNDVVVTEHEFPYPIEFTSVTTSVSTSWGMRQIKISAWNTTTNQYDVILNSSQGAITATHAMTQVVRAKKFKFEFQGGRFAPNKVYYNCLTDITLLGTVYQSTQKGNTLICAPCTITTADGRTKKFTSQIGYDIPSNLADGTYKVLKSIVDGSLSLVKNLAISNISPLEPNSNDYWLDTSQAPLYFKKYSNNDWVEDNDKVYIADVVVSEFFFTVVENIPFNKEYSIEKSYISSLGMPSSKYDDLTLGASGTKYVAPANGYFFIDKIAGTDSRYCQLIALKDPNGSLEINNMLHRTFRGEYRTSPCTCLLPVKKGDTVAVDYNATGATNLFRFIYAEGEDN